MLISADTENDSDVIALTGASAALSISSIPFKETIAAVRVGLVDGKFLVKVSGITMDIMRKALEQARQGRMHILGKMAETLGTARADISTYAPRIITIKIPVEKIRDVIGSGGKTIRSIVERTGVKIDVEDDGRINIASSDDAAAQKARPLFGKRRFQIL